MLSFEENVYFVSIKLKKEKKSFRWYRLLWCLEKSRFS